MNQSAKIQQISRMLHQIGHEWWGVKPGVLSVPFITHDADQAASAALSMVLCYYGCQSPDLWSPETLPSTPWGEWNLPQFLATTAQTCGLAAAVKMGNLNQLTEWLQQGVPVLVFPESEIRGAGEPVAIVTGLTHDRTAICIHYGATPHRWLRLPDFLALCGGNTFITVPVAERHQATHARSRTRVRRPGQESPWQNFLPDPISAMAA